MRPRKMQVDASGHESGFTLFEISIAIAMIAIGFLGVLATLSAGLSMAHRAKTNATAPMAARSAAVYFMVTGKSGDIGGVTKIDSGHADLKGLYPRGQTAVHDTHGDRSTTGLSKDSFPFSGYAMTIEVNTISTLGSTGTTAHDLTITVYENPDDRKEKRNSVGTFQFTVFRMPEDDA